jgi:hypothetical protein
MDVGFDQIWKKCVPNDSSGSSCPSDVQQHRGVDVEYVTLTPRDVTPAAHRPAHQSKLSLWAERRSPPVRPTFLALQALPIPVRIDVNVCVIGDLAVGDVRFAETPPFSGARSGGIGAGSSSVRFPRHCRR